MPTIGLSSESGNPGMGYLMQKIEIRTNWILRCAISCGTLLFCLVAWPSSLLGVTPFGDWRDDIGYTKLIGFLGDTAPNGAGVPISMVEAPLVGSSAYFPIVDHGFFSSESDPLEAAVNFTDGSGGQGSGESSHAFEQAVRFFGNTTSVAEAANQVTIYEANDYLSNVLNLNSGNSVLPDTQDFRVQNFSWVGTFATPNDSTPLPTPAELNKDREALRRFDFAINANNITALVGLSNSSVALPHLLSHSYNSIAVGRSDGAHSTGLTHLNNYGIGRSKPDLVAPEESASTATSITSSVAAFLHSADTVVGSNAAKSQTMKALLLAGATKEEIPTWSQIDTSGEWHPLDDTYGAGQLNLYNSYLMTKAGRGVGSTNTPTPVTSHGWDFQTIQPGAGNELLYDFVIPSGSTAAELSIVLTWNAKVDAPFHTGAPVVADLNLELVDANGSTVDLNISDSAVDGLSESDVDNVEHLYLKSLAAGTYTLKVSSDDLASDFGLAWRTSTFFHTFTADFDEDGDTDGSDFLTWQRGYGTLVNATRADGDADGDGDVDFVDLALHRAGFLAATPSLSSSILAVPEPATWALAVLGLLLVFGWRYRQAFVSLG